MCRYDLARACLKALELDPVGYTAFHVVGALQARQRFDIARTEKELGLAFESQFEGCD